jgi:hypothetical protein
LADQARLKGFAPLPKMVVLDRLFAAPEDNTAVESIGRIKAFALAEETRQPGISLSPHVFRHDPYEAADDTHSLLEIAQFQGPSC